MNPIDKEEKIARQNLQRLINHVKSEYTFHKKRTFGDYLLSLGYSDEQIKHTLHYRPDELTRQISFSELKDLLEDLRISLDVRFYLKRNPPITEYDTRTEQTGVLQSTNIVLPDNTTPIRKDIVSISERDNSNYDLSPSEKEKCNLYWFQKRDTKRLLDNALIKNQRAQLLLAQAGHGKTFILGAFLRRLLDANYHVSKTITAWPYFYITKASVVEQTKRVMRDKFSIDLITELTVTNYDQLRATLGELYLEEKTIVEDNQEHIIWEWRPLIHPLVFIIDECQAAKNRDSTQSKIIRAIGKLKHPDIRIVFSSATPFTRVIESEYFCVNAGLEMEMIV